MTSFLKDLKLLSIAVILSTMMAIDYHIYLRGGNSIFFVDKSELQKDLREIQRLEIKNKLKELKAND